MPLTRTGSRTGQEHAALPRCFRFQSSTDVSLQTPRRDGISDGIHWFLRALTYVSQAFPARLNIIARYVERMLGTAQDGYKPLK